MSPEPPEKDLSHEYKLPSRSIAETYDRLGDLVNRLQKDRTLKFQGRKLSAEAVVNAILLHALSMDEGVIDEVIRLYVLAVEALLRGDKLQLPLPGHIHTPPPKIELPPDPMTEKPRRPKRKSS